MAQAYPSGTVTFLFTDIQGSTQLWDAFPDEMRAALSIHDRLIGDAVSAAAGVVVKSTGDGVFAAFSTAGAAAEAAIQAQRAIAAHEWDDVIGSIEVRMALHTDDAQPTNGDYHGSAVNRTARIEAAGHGGQILLSNATAVALEDRLPDGAELIELGKHSLRGLSRPEIIHQLSVAGLPSTFPPLRTASVAAGVLPEFATSFVGRTKDLEELADQLSTGECRVMTLLGPGGIGKTRLSVETARRVAEASGAVAHFVGLASVSSEDAIIGEIADSLNFNVDLHLSSVIDEATQVIDLLKKQRMVLILDNFEHLTAGAALVTRMIETAPDLKVLVTSRERLKIASEWVYELGGMATAGTGEAGALFVDRARRAGGMVDDEMAPEIESLCELLGGMPLAIELAAAWTPVIPVGEIASEVKNSLDILAGSLADVPARHRSVRAAFEQSWKRLEPELQASFSALAIFPAPFTREAAAAVTGAGLPTLMTLMNKSLLRRAELDTYDIHPLLRELGLEALGEKRDELAASHGDYYVERLMERAAALRGGPDQIAVKDELAAELGNLRPATLWAVANLPADEAVAMLRVLDEFYFLASWAQAIDHFEALAQVMVDRLGAEVAIDDVRYLWAKTFATLNLSQFGNVDTVLEEATSLLPHWESSGEELGLAWAWNAIGVAHDQAGRLDEARTALERALEIGLGDDGLLRIHHDAWYGWVTMEQGDAAGAVRIWREGLSQVEASGHQTGRAYLLSKLGVASDELGDHEEAARLHLESREVFVKTGDIGGEGYTLSRLSWTYWLTGDYLKAKQYGEEGLAKFDEINHRWGVGTSWCRIGMAEVGLGELDAATASFMTGLDLAIENKMQALSYYALLGMGKVFAAEGRIEEGVKLLAYNVAAPQNPYAELAQKALDELGDAASQEMQQAGGAMTNDEAVALARSR